MAKMMKDWIDQWPDDLPADQWDKAVAAAWHIVLQGGTADTQMRALIAYGMIHDHCCDMMVATLLHPNIDEQTMRDMIAGEDPLGLDPLLVRDIISPNMKPDITLLLSVRDLLREIGQVAPAGYEWRPLSVAALATWLAGEDPSADIAAADIVAPMRQGFDGRPPRSLAFHANIVRMAVDTGLWPSWTDGGNRAPSRPAMPMPRRIQSLRLTVPTI